MWLAGGCSRATEHGRQNRTAGVLVIDEERIARSGGATAWDVLKREAPHLSFRDRPSGQPAAMGRRGRASLNLNDPPLVFLDGVRIPDFRVLDQISATTVAVIYVLTGIEGTTYYGTNAVSGVILVHTKHGQ
jgi:outer membrane cobalamin receptor